MCTRTATATCTKRKEHVVQFTGREILPTYISLAVSHVQTYISRSDTTTEQIDTHRQHFHYQETGCPPFQAYSRVVSVSAVVSAASMNVDDCFQLLLALGYYQ